MKNEGILKSNQTKGWRMGLKNLLDREMGKWWQTSRWCTQTLVWGLITNGVLGLLLFLLPFLTATFEGINQAELADIPDGTTAFFSLAGIAMPIGVVVLVQGSIITEKELGTAEWVLSKPVSRSAFVLSKLIAHSLGFFITYVVFQTSIAYVIISNSQGSPQTLLGFIKGAGILTLILFFYLTLTLMMEVLVDSRGIVLGVTLGAALGGALLVNLFPFFALITPFAMPNLIPLIVMETTLPEYLIWLPFFCTFIMCLIFITISLWRFNKKSL